MQSFEDFTGNMSEQPGERINFCTKPHIKKTIQGVANKLSKVDNLRVHPEAT